MNGAEKDSKRKSNAVAVVLAIVIFFSFLLCFARSEPSANPKKGLEIKKKPSERMPTIDITVTKHPALTKSYNAKIKTGELMAKQ
jgi:hypothetical protein